jgi:hypothetical protein
MTHKLAFAVVASTLAAAPAYAQENLLNLDYMEVTTSHTLEPQASFAEYSLDTGASATGVLANQVAIAYGLTNTLTVAGALHAGGEGAQDVGTPSYMVGMVYAPRVVRDGWSPALQLQYQGGFNQSVVARGVFSYDAPALAFGNRVIDRFNLSANLVVEQAFVGAGETSLAYAAGLTYPLWGRALNLADIPAGTAMQQLQRRPDSTVRATVELKGALGAQGSHYVIPGLFVSPMDALQLGVGVGLRLAGEDRPLYVQAQAQLSF